MTEEHEPQLTFQTIHECPSVTVSDYVCRACRGGPVGEEHVDNHQVVLLRHGVFCKHVGRQTVTADVNHAVFFDKETTYRVSHPVDCGDRGTVFTLSPRVLRDMLGEFDLAHAEQSEAGFPFLSGPCDASVFWSYRELLYRLQADASPSPETMWVEETALQMMADVLTAAFKSHSEPTKSGRRSTIREHAERAEAAKCYLAATLGDHITLDNVAQTVGVSAFHLTRLFKRHTGLTVHRYLTLLRLRESIERLAGGADHLATLAVDLGYASHSHFTDTFRAEYGCTPSEVRSRLRR